MLREPRRHRGVLVRAVVIEDEVELVPAGRLPTDRVQEGEKLGMGVPRLTALDHVPLEDIQRGKQGGRPVPLIVVRLVRRDPGPQRQDGLSAIQRLNLALLIDAQYQGVSWR